MEHKDSFDRWKEDVLVRSLDCRDWIRRFEPSFILGVLKEGQNEALRSIYTMITRSLKLQTNVVDRSGIHEVEKVIYHSIFGWVLEASDSRAYLGKVSIPDPTPIEIGRQSYISGHATIRGIDPLKVGQFASIAEGLYLNTSPDLHPTQYAAMINFASEVRSLDAGLEMAIAYEQLDEQSRGIEIGNDVWIGRDVRLFHGAYIADGCVIAERSLVRGKTEPYGVYAGIPAQLKRHRFSQSTIEALQEIRWWNWPKDRILRNKRFFEVNLAHFSGNVQSLVEA